MLDTSDPHFWLGTWRGNWHGIMEISISVEQLDPAWVIYSWSGSKLIPYGKMRLDAVITPDVLSFRLGYGVFRLVRKTANKVEATFVRCGPPSVSVLKRVSAYML